MTLTEVQTMVRDWIAADDWFAPLADAILVEARGDFEQQLQRTLDRMGLSIVVATPSSSLKEPASVPYLTAEVVVAIAETPALNDTGKSAAAALDRIIPLVHRLALGESGAPRLQFQGHEAEDIPGMAAYRVRYSVNLIATSTTS